MSQKLTLFLMTGTLAVFAFGQKIKKLDNIF